MSRPEPAVRLHGADLTAATDAQDVATALTGQQDAAREIVRRYQRPVYNLIARMVQDTGTAEDLAQETFIKVFRSLRTFDARLRFAAWILKIAHNTTIDYLRRHLPQLVPLDAPMEGDERSFATELRDQSAVTPERAAERQQGGRQRRAGVRLAQAPRGLFGGGSAPGLERAVERHEGVVPGRPRGSSSEPRSTPPSTACGPSTAASSFYATRRTSTTPTSPR